MYSLSIFRPINDAHLLDEIRAEGIETAGIRKLQGGGHELFINPEDKDAAQAIVDAHDYTWTSPRAAPREDTVAAAISEHERRFHPRGPE